MMPPADNSDFPRISYMNQFSIRLLAAGGLLALAAGLHAAPPKKEATLGGGKGDGPIMQMNELRACIKQQARLQTHSEELVKAQADMKAERAAIDTESAAIKTELETVDRTNEEALKVVVERAKANDKRIDDYQARVPGFNAQVEAVQAERAAYAKSCEGRRYLEDDYKDIKAGK
jgi:hypothetical protein